jgi:hypothetical protein
MNVKECDRGVAVVLQTYESVGVLVRELAVVAELALALEKGEAGAITPISAVASIHLWVLEFELFYLAPPW